jgi:hypothetical protein
VSDWFEHLALLPSLIAVRPITVGAWAELTVVKNDQSDCREYGWAGPATHPQRLFCERTAVSTRHGD